jgi:hypothetical protein
MCGCNKRRPVVDPAQVPAPQPATSRQDRTPRPEPVPAR